MVLDNNNNNSLEKSYMHNADKSEALAAFFQHCVIMETLELDVKFKRHDNVCIQLIWQR